MSGWLTGDAGLGHVVEEQTKVCLNVYAEDPSRVQQDANNERRISQGGYAERQFEELLQNATDAARNGGGRIEVYLSDHALYVANDGEPFSEAGVRAVMASDISAKDDEQIGKFGIGFKSVLAVSDAPSVFSRSVSFGFDRAWASEVLSGAGYDEPHYPVMRLARVLDPVADGSAVDPVLAELMQWASTVVVAPLSVAVAGLAARLAQFPPEFILFSSHLAQVRLRSVLGGGLEALSGERVIERKAGPDGFVTVTSGRDSSKWSVASRSVAVSQAAFAEAGHVAARRSVEVQYAVQVPPSAKDGSFWAYFPTTVRTTLSGIVNAPWKLSDDRLNILESDFNRELLEVIPELVGHALSKFEGSGHEAAILDALPSRGGELGTKEARNWVDEAINQPIFDNMSSMRCLVAADGTLRVPKAVEWLGDLGAADWLDAWESFDEAPVGSWLHREAYGREERRLKVSRLKGSGASIAASASTLAGWLEALTESRSVASSAFAITLAAKVLTDDETMRDFGRRSRGKDFITYQREVREHIAQARILLLEDGSFSAPVKGKVFVRVPGEGRDDVAYVAPDLVKIDGLRTSLSALGVVLMDRSGELRKLLAQWCSVPAASRSGTLWAQIWPLMRSMPLEAVLEILREDLDGYLNEHVHVRTASGTWARLRDAFIGGRLVPMDGTRDLQVLIDPREHESDGELLRALGALELPTSRSTRSLQVEAWLRAWDQRARDEYMGAKGARIDETKIDVSLPNVVAWPLQPVIGMSPEGRAAMTQLLLARGLPLPVSVKHRSNNAYGSISVVGPETYFLEKYGAFRTSHGVLASGHVLVASEDLDPAVFPTVEIDPSLGAQLGMHDGLDGLREEDWLRMKQVVDTWVQPEQDAARTTFYSWMLYCIPADRLRTMKFVVPVGQRRLAVEVPHIGVTGSKQVCESMQDASIPVLRVSEEGDLEKFISDLGLARGEDLLQEEVVVDAAGEPVFIVDAYPPLRVWLQPGDHTLKIQPVSRLVKMTATPQGQKAKPLPYRREDDVVYVTAEEPTRRILQIAQALGLGMDVADAKKVLLAMEKAASNKLRTEVRRCKDDDERLVVAVGEEALRRSVPQQALQILDGEEGRADAKEVAALARAVHGVGILKHLKAALEDRGLEPPQEWAGRRVTRQWVVSLGFPSDWAGFESTPRAAVELIDGPAVLKPLHDYQEYVTEKIQALLSGIGKERGLVSLPTGAGKTRVTVEALVTAIRNGMVSTDQPLLWIAQTDELCEQAAETWRYVWRAIGPQISMRLGRLWSQNEVTEEPGIFQLVIATNDKLLSITKRHGEYDWLREPSVVIIDEAHTSIAASYTTTLEWLNRSGRKRDEGRRRPLIGLTATPFKGTSESETERLVKRYDGNRLDRGAFLKEDPYEELQAMGVLAQVRHELLDGVDVTLNDQDKADIEKLRKIPSHISEALGANTARTLRVVDSIASLPDDWTVLAFAPSVENARVLAALLAHRGIPAVSVSSDTDPAARKHYIDEFKAGRIRVITNYGVLTQGFDAPKVQAVYIARPTFSPNVYQQMIGRGLRGPLNGGSEEVLIVNVRDNFNQFGELLAFNEFEYLWKKKP